MLSPPRLFSSPPPLGSGEELISAASPPPVHPQPPERGHGLRLMHPLIGSILRLRLLCAAMHRCLFCHSRCMMDGLSQGGCDPATAAWEMGVSPGGHGCAFWVAWGDGGALCWTLHPHCLQFAFICRSCASEEAGELQAAAPNGGDKPALGLGEAAAQPRAPKSSVCPQSMAPSQSGEQEQAADPSMAPRTTGEPGACTPLPRWLCDAVSPGQPRAPGPRGRARAAPYWCQALAVATLSLPSSSSAASPRAKSFLHPS